MAQNHLTLWVWPRTTSAREKCIIQWGESSLFTLNIDSLCCEYLCWDGRAFSPLGQATLLFCCQPGKGLCFGDGKDSVRSSKLSFQHRCNLCSCLDISQSSLCKPLGFSWVVQLPRSSPGAGQALCFVSSSSILFTYDIYLKTIGIHCKHNNNTN